MKRHVIRNLEAIYSKLPKVPCKRLCGSYCGPIPLQVLELRRILESLSGGTLPAPCESGSCPLLKNGECTRYQLRPLICRIFGAVPRLACPHGCEPERWMTDAEVAAIMRQLLKISPELVTIGLE